MVFNVIKTAILMFVIGVGMFSISATGFYYLMQLAEKGAAYYFGVLGVLMLIACFVCAYFSEKDKALDKILDERD